MTTAKGLPMLSYEQIYQLSKDIKSSLHSCAIKHHPEFPSYNTFPEFPMQLPNDVWKLAYDPDDPPISKPLAEIPALVKDHTPVRSTSKLLKANQKGASHAVPTAREIAQELRSMEQADGQVPIIYAGAVGQKVAGAVGQLAAPPSGKQLRMQLSPASDSQESSDVAPAERFTPRTRIPVSAIMDQSRAQPKALMDERAQPQALKDEGAVAVKPNQVNSSVTGPVAPPTNGPADGQLTAEQLEQQACDLLNKHAARNAGKRPAHVLKKPAGNTKKTKGTKKPKGCSRCRGLSCTTCQNPNFGGTRISREDWLKAHGGR